MSLVSVIYAIISEQLSSAESKTTAMSAHADTLTTDLDISVKESTLVNLSLNHMCLADVGLLVSPSGGRGASVLSVILPVTKMMVCFLVERVRQCDCYRPFALTVGTSALEGNLDDYLLFAG